MFPTLRLLAVVSQPFKRAQLGLFQGKMRQTGNSIPFSKHKTRRSWLPNVQSKRYFSDILQETLRVKVTTRAIKTIKKYGGSIDQYVLKTKPDLLGWEGMRIRIMVRERMEANPQQPPVVPAVVEAAIAGVAEEAIPAAAEEL